MSRSRKVELVARALAVVCLGCLPLSTRAEFGVAFGRNAVGCVAGCLSAVRLSTTMPPVPPEFYLDRYRYRVLWKGSILRGGNFVQVMVPLWVPFILCLTIAVLAHRRASGPKPGTCPKCGYDLAGNVTGKCSECGAART